MISIIVPIYNAELYIHQCINNILIQNNKDFELLLINDGSTDQSGLICEDYAAKDKRIKVFHKNNGGVSSARNWGLKYAKGEWITFIDADDNIEQNFLSISYNQTASLLVQKWKDLESNKEHEYISTQFIPLEKKHIFLKNNLHKYLFRCPWAKFFKSSIIKSYNITFNEKYKIGEDTLFVLDYLFYCNTIEIINTSYYIYRKNENSTKYKEKIDITLAYIMDFWRKYEILKCNNKELLKIKYNYYRNITIDINLKENLIKWNSNEYTLKLWKAIYIRTFKDYLIYLKWKVICIIKKIIQ